MCFFFVAAGYMDNKNIFGIFVPQILGVQNRTFLFPISPVLNLTWDPMDGMQTIKKIVLNPKMHKVVPPYNEEL